MFSNLIKPFRNISLVLIYIALTLLGGYLWWHFTDIAIMLGNYGKVRTYFDSILSGVMIIGFPLFIIGILYKGYAFGHRENLHHQNGIGTIGGIIGTVLSGCSCCGLTLASYFGLLPLMNMLPYSGLEIKVLATLGLLWALSDTYKNLEICRVKR